MKWLLAVLLAGGLSLLVTSVVSIFRQNRAEGVSRWAAVGLVPILIVAGLLLGIALVTLEASLVTSVVVALAAGLVGGWLYLVKG